jgi:hypothetical protein
MSNKKNAKNAPAILIWAAAFLLAYGVFLYSTNYSADLAESNLQANLIRASRYLNDQPASIALIGSSVAGRLLPEYFQREGLTIQNLGMDGSRPLFGFEIINRRPQLPARLLVETSTLFQPLMANDAVLRDALNSTSWQVASIVGLMRPENRPSSILYSWFKAKKEIAMAGREQPPYLTSSEQSPSSAAVRVAPDWRPEEQYETVRKALADFQSRGVEIIILNIPRGAGWGVADNGMDRQLADDLGVPLLEPGPRMAAAGVQLTFSDGTHLDGKSALKVTAEIAHKLKELK